MLSPRTIILCIAFAAAAHATAANAAWVGSGTGSHYVKAVSMPAGKTPTASVSNRSVTVSWAASTMPGGASVSGYVVKRYDTSGNVQTIGSGCSGTVSALTCTETAVPGGSWKYTVAPVRGNWTGAEGSQSAAATVAGPSLSFTSSTTVTSLPTTLSGSVAGFVSGQTLTFRLDNPSTGAVLSSTLSPTPIPSGGGSSVTVTVPPGTANGSHTIYAVGSGGSDIASKSITVAVTYTATESAWDLRDASSGSENNRSSTSAFSDPLMLFTGSWPSTFSGVDYVDFDENAPLPAGFAVTGATFNFKYSASLAGETACYWFEVRSASTGAVLGTHGSASSPVDCTTGTTLKAVSTSIPELNTADLANDARVRVYGQSSGSHPIVVDVATVTGTQQSTPFTLYSTSYTDATSGTPAIIPWSLAAADGSAYTSDTSWTNAFGTGRYLKLTFPSYIPSGAAVTGATLTHSFRATAKNKTACYYLEVYSGSTLVASRGSSSSAYSCNSTSSVQTDTIPLPEINTPAEANGTIVKLYFDVSGGGTRTTDHDLAQLAIDYK